MSRHVLVLLFLGAGGTSCGVFSQMCNLMMIGEINRRKGDDEQISYFGYHAAKQIRVIREYRRLYPTGRLHLAMLATFILGGGMLGALFALLGIWHR